MKIVDINLMDDATLIEIWDDFVEDMKEIPVDEGKQFFRDWQCRVPAKLIRSCIFAGIHYALKHKDSIDITSEK